MRAPSLLLLLISAAFLASAFYVSVLSFFGFFLLVPLIVSAVRARSFLDAFSKGTLFGFVFMFFVAIWILEAFSVRWIDDVSFLAGSAVVLVMLTTSLILGACFGFFAACVRQCAPLLKKRNSVSFFIFSLGVASCFVFFEFLRPYLFSILTVADFFPEPFFSIGFLGYLASSFPGIRSFSQFGDVYVLSFVLALSNATLAYIVVTTSRKERMLRVSGVLFAFLLLELCIPFVTPMKEIRSLPSVAGVGLMLPAQSDTVERDAASRAALLTLSPSLSSTTLVIFPETFGSSLAGDEILQNRQALLSGRTRLKDRSIFSAAVVSEGERTPFVEKSMLVPYGEYVPTVARSLIRAMMGNAAESITKTLDAVPGASPRTLAYNGARVGVLFCNEVWAPSSRRFFKKEPTDFVAVIASHASFNQSALLEAQEERVLQVRAVSYGAPIVQVTNMGTSYVVSGSGKILARYPQGESFVYNGALR